MGEVIHIGFEGNVFAVDLGLYHCHNAVYQLSQVHFLLRQYNAPTLYFRHIQHFIDQAQQQLRGNRDLSQTVLNPFRIMDMGLRYGSHTQYGIHRGTDIMAHSGQEV